MERAVPVEADERGRDPRDCSDCGAEVRRNYCRDCDAFFFNGHSQGCADTDARAHRGHHRRVTLGPGSGDRCSRGSRLPANHARCPGHLLGCGTEQCAIFGFNPM